MNITFDEVGHTYTDEHGNIIPSVTQILGKVYGTGLEDAPEYFVKRAAEKGTAIHKEIDTYLKTGKHGETPEFKVWHEWFTRFGEPKTDYESELIIYAKTPYGAFAGTADFLSAFLDDWKTSKTATRPQIKKWQMQMSMYKYALVKMGRIVNEPLKIVHITAEGVKIINVDYLGDAWVEETMRLYAAGEQPEVANTELQTVSKAELEQLEYLLSTVSKMEKMADDIRGKIKEEMERRGILNIQAGKINISYVAGTVRQTFDSKKLKEEKPEVYAAYLKDSAVKPSVRISIKE